MEKREKQFVYNWQKEFSWTNDPFKIGIPEPIDHFLSGYEEERKKLNYCIIQKQKVCLVEGDKGTGRTMLLTWLKNQLRDYTGTNVLFIDSSIKKEIIIKELVYRLLKFKERIAVGQPLKIKSLIERIKDERLRNIAEAINFSNIEVDTAKLYSFINERLSGRSFLLVVDDLDNMSEENFKVITGAVASIPGFNAVFCGNKKSLEKIHYRDKPTRVELRGLEYEEMVEMLRKRIEGCNGKDLEPFEDSELKSLYKKSGGNPLVFLESAREKAIHIAINGVNYGKKKEELHSDKYYDDKKNDNKDESYNIKVISQPKHDIRIQTVKQENDVIDPKKISKEKIEIKKIK